MSIENIKNAIPDYAKDIKLNLSSLANEETLNAQQFWGTALASALACGNAFVISEIQDEAAQSISPEALAAAKAAASIMAMNNVYYKFTGFMGEDYRTMPAKLRMNVIANPGVDKADFELWSLAVSAINGCAFCVKAHEKQITDHGMSKEMVQTAIRIAAVIHAAAARLSGESALKSEMAQAA